jgi:hypothetical protein
MKSGDAPLMLVPGSAGYSSSQYLAFSVDNGHVAFNAGWPTGLLTNASGTFTVAADTTTPMPNAPGNFWSFNYASLSGQKVAFTGWWNGSVAGIYEAANGEATAVADLNDFAPGGSGRFIGFGAPSYRHGTLVFEATFAHAGTQFGIYRSIDGGPVTKVLDTTDGIFTSDGLGIRPFPTGSGDNVVFWSGKVTGGNGIYLSSPSGISVVADTNTRVPGTTVNFYTFEDELGLDGTNVAFVGRTDGTLSGITLCTTLGGGLSRVLGVGDALDGKTVAGISTSNESISGSAIVFEARFTDSSSGIFIATVPEPAALPALAFAILAARRRVKPGQA